MSNPETTAASGNLELVTMRVAGQPFGIPVSSVHDVLAAQKITRVPLAPPSVAGALNLRGRIVTVLDLRVALGFAPSSAAEQPMNVVIAHDKEVYALLVDEVGDVLTFPTTSVEQPPHTLSPAWRAMATGIVRLEDELLLTLVPERLLATVVGSGQTAGGHA